MPSVGHSTDAFAPWSSAFGGIFDPSGWSSERFVAVSIESAVSVDALDIDHGFGPTDAVTSHTRSTVLIKLDRSSEAQPAARSRSGGQAIARGAGARAVLYLSNRQAHWARDIRDSLANQ